MVTVNISGLELDQDDFTFAWAGDCQAINLLLV